MEGSNPWKRTFCFHFNLEILNVQIMLLVGYGPDVLANLLSKTFYI
jgi:hypothetical protein